jgi:hypothetical protein
MSVLEEASETLDELKSEEVPRRKRCILRAETDASCRIDNSVYRFESGGGEATEGSSFDF